MVSKVDELRDALTASTAELARGLDRAALALSGGVDSCCALFALLDLGLRPRCLTFTLGGYESEDLAAARKVARAFHLELDVVRIPHNPEVLEKDVRWLIPHTGTRKTWVQCGHPWLYLAVAAKEAGFDKVFCALMADELWGTSRKVMAYWRAEGDYWALERRRENFEELRGVAVAERVVARELGVTILDPFNNDRVRDVMLGCGYADLHRPVPKAMALAMYDGLFRLVEHRRPLNYQIGSGIRAWHDTLLSGPLNARGSKAVVAVYNDIAAGRV